jgi:hypothetical protein
MHRKGAKNAKEKNLKSPLYAFCAFAVCSPVLLIKNLCVFFVLFVFFVVKIFSPLW